MKQLLFVVLMLCYIRQTTAQAVSGVKSLTLDGSPNIYYEEKGVGEPIILIHGLGLDCRMWDDQFEVLATRFRVLRLDLPGFGRSGDPTGPYSMSDAVFRVLQAAKTGPANVIGLSMGGDVAMQLALTHPEAVKRLVLADATLNGFDYGPAFTARVGAILQAASKEGVTRANQLWLSDSLFVPARENRALAQRLTDMVMVYRGSMWQHFFDWPQSTKQPVSQQLGAIRQPTLVLVGDRDIGDLRRIADILGRQLPNARLVTLPGAGHMANMEAPTRFNELTLDFLTQKP